MVWRCLRLAQVCRNRPVLQISTYPRECLIFPSFLNVVHIKLTHCRPFIRSYLVVDILCFYTMIIELKNIFYQGRHTFWRMRNILHFYSECLDKSSGDLEGKHLMIIGIIYFIRSYGPHNESTCYVHFSCIFFRIWHLEVCHCYERELCNIIHYLFFILQHSKNFICSMTNSFHFS